MESDYSITIFSRHKGKTRTFNLNRRVVYLSLAILLVLVVSCIFFAQAYLQEREKNQRLEGRIALLEQLMAKFEKRSEMQGGEGTAQKTMAATVTKPPTVAKPPTVTKLPAVAKPSTVTRPPTPTKPPTLAKPPTVAKPPAEIAQVEEKGETSSEGRESQNKIGSPTEADGQTVAKVDDLKVIPLAEDREGFEFSFKLVNLTDEPIAGNVAIVASLRPPHQPQFISFPSMRLEDGMPVKLRKSVGFSIRYFKYVSGKFAFQFSFAKSFRVLVYDQEEHLILDRTVNAEDVVVSELLNEEPAPPASPGDPPSSS
jgi:hypothetical protein